MEQEISIIKGTIYNEKREVVWNAVVKIIEIDPELKTYNELGYVLTDKEGNYAFALEGNSEYIYQITIYPPLNG